MTNHLTCDCDSADVRQQSEKNSNNNNNNKDRESNHICPRGTIQNTKTLRAYYYYYDHSSTSITTISTGTRPLH